MLKNESKIKGILAKVRADIMHDIEPCLNINHTTGGFFSVPLILFSFIEYLGVLWKNPVEYKNKKRVNYYLESHIPKAAIPYIKKYLGKVRSEYKIYSGLLYGLYRHSIVHHYSPSEILVNNKILTWEIIKDSRENHLLCTKKKLCKENGKIIEKIILTINIEIFYKDLLKSIDEFEKDALKFKTISNNILRADNKLNNPHPDIFLRKYIRDDLRNI